MRTGENTSSGAPTEASVEPELSNGTERILALSDGVFAFAITLLVLNIKIPDIPVTHAPPTAERIWAALLLQWPTYFAYIYSFITVAIMWANHVTIFRYIKRSDHTLMMLNAILLLCISLNPFITSLLAAYLLLSAAHRQIGMLVFSGTWFVTAVVFNIIWFYASSGRRLIDERFTEKHYRDISARYAFGPAGYVAALILCLFGQETLALFMSVILALVFAFPYNINRAKKEVDILGDDAERWIFRRGMPKK